MWGLRKLHTSQEVLLPDLEELFKFHLNSEINYLETLVFKLKLVKHILVLKKEKERDVTVSHGMT